VQPGQFGTALIPAHGQRRFGLITAGGVFCRVRFDERAIL
jgi:hypothetical protein